MHLFAKRLRGKGRIRREKADVSFGIIQEIRAEI